MSTNPSEAQIQVTILRRAIELTRITLNGMKVSRPDVRIGRYRMIKHERDKHNEPNPQRFNKIQNTKNTMKKDGISSLTYRVIQFKRYALYTNISVEIGKPPPRPIKG
ncbi:Beta-1,4-galactosyltransferase 2 [Dissostichus eleginoides]|nr:Beta-1,4-galactosyltransferase 2 [Dissostichus eleginoides]